MATTMYRHHVTIARRACCALLLFMPRLLTAQAAPDAAGERHPMTLADVLEVALRQNPDLGIAQATLDSARAESRVARAWPNPMYAAIPGTPYQYGVTMPIDVGPQRLYRTRASARGVDASRADQRDVTRQVTFNVQRAFVDALLADTLETISRGRREVVRQVLIADSVRLRSGDLAARDLFRVEGELARADADLVRAHTAALSARLTLQVLMGISPDTTFTIAGALRFVPTDVPDDSALVQNALSRRPDAAASAVRVEQSRAQRNAAAASLVPTPQLSYVRQYSAPFESGRYYAFGIAVEVPVLNLYSGQRERAAAGAAAATFAQRRVTAQIRRDVTAAAADLRAQRGLVQRLESGLLAKTDAAVEATRYAYGRGATSLLDVLDATRSQQEVRIDYFTALHDYSVSVYALNAAVGADVVSVTR